MGKFENTQSFYDTSEEFKKYLGQTSYYKMLQHSVSKIVSILKPERILELGFGTGSTSIMLAEENKEIEITAVDLREDMKVIAETDSNKLNLKNISFIVSDMSEYIYNLDKIQDFILFLYSFHHIEDPIEKKLIL
jgi:ubiquinone/menaquinone biosynthesis C-methylase UbiE